MVRALLRRLWAWCWRSPAGIAALDGGPGPQPEECPQPLAGVRLVRLPVDAAAEAAARDRQMAALAHLPTATLSLSFCEFDAAGRCIAHEECHGAAATG